MDLAAANCAPNLLPRVFDFLPCGPGTTAIGAAAPTPPATGRDEPVLVLPRRIEDEGDVPKTSASPATDDRCCCGDPSRSRSRSRELDESNGNSILLSSCSRLLLEVAEMKTKSASGWFLEERKRGEDAAWSSLFTVFSSFRFPGWCCCRQARDGGENEEGVEAPSPSDRDCDWEVEEEKGVAGLSERNEAVAGGGVTAVAPDVAGGGSILCADDGCGWAGYDRDDGVVVVEGARAGAGMETEG